ncbi:MAG: hypothetical protein WCV41_01775 [Patescibacteria group bacterium]
MCDKKSGIKKEELTPYEQDKLFVREKVIESIANHLHQNVLCQFEGRKEADYYAAEKWVGKHPEVVDRAYFLYDDHDDEGFKAFLIEKGSEMIREIIFS